MGELGDHPSLWMEFECLFSSCCLGYLLETTHRDRGMPDTANRMMGIPATVIFFDCPAADKLVTDHRKPTPPITHYQ